MSTRNIWVRSETEVWVAAEVLSVLDNSQYIIKYKNNDEEYTVYESEILDMCDNNVTDLTKMSHLNEGNILEVINIRYNNSEIYTKTGEVLLAVNPFKNLDIYDIDKYLENYTIDTPHVYYNSQMCMDRLVSKNKPQSILVSGESGAGKTQTTKYILEYLSHISRLTNINTTNNNTNIKK